MTPLADRRDSQLVLIDVQERLCSAMPQPALATTIRNCAMLLQAGRLLQVPTLYTEQYPKGLGPTLPELAPWLDSATRIEKICFSCWADNTFRDQLGATTRHQIVLAGMEAHICVLQTALDLHAAGCTVFVVEDAVLSRNPLHHANAMARLRHHGVIVSNTESVVFEWLKTAEGDTFKQISRLIR